MNNRMKIATLVVILVLFGFQSGCASEKFAEELKFAKSYLEYTINDTLGKVESKKTRSDFIHPDWRYPGSDDLNIGIIGNYEILGIRKGSKENINGHDKDRVFVVEVKFNLYGWLRRGEKRIEFEKELGSRRQKLFISNSTGEPLLLHNDFYSRSFATYKDALNWLKENAQKQPEVLMNAYKEVKNLKQ